MRFYVISLLAVALLFAPISARRMRRQAEPETTTESGSETTTDLNSSGTEASGEESGVETSGAETSGAEGSGLESSGVDASGNEASGDVSGEEPIESQVPVLTLSTIQASALTLQAQADIIALQTQSITNQMNLLTQEVQNLEKEAEKLNTQVSNAIIEAGSTPATSTNETLESNSTSTCSLDKACFADSDCNGGTCPGAFVGTCNCNACLQLKACMDDSQCGGFKTACSNVTNTCDCFQAFVNNGFPSFLDAQTSMCNKATCTMDNTDACFGLPCNAGRCIC
ncbi:hypothetical protein WR25_11885 [Diploscapter pachys]|uniref:Chondroitin proteoglycan 3 n=1 Tax=Diploscapter pachys TaxID=2018661 RepID=A0A2A2JB29_9BILA|nr:hypothetical protein WR25_11885 [Diploscapter pachys]